MKKWSIWNPFENIFSITNHALINATGNLFYKKEKSCILYLLRFEYVDVCFSVAETL